MEHDTHAEERRYPGNEEEIKRFEEIENKLDAALADVAAIQGDLKEIETGELHLVSDNLHDFAMELRMWRQDNLEAFEETSDIMINCQLSLEDIEKDLQPILDEIIRRNENLVDEVINDEPDPNELGQFEEGLDERDVNEVYIDELDRAIMSNWYKRTVKKEVSSDVFSDTMKVTITKNGIDEILTIPTKFQAGVNINITNNPQIGRDILGRLVTERCIALNKETKALFDKVQTMGELNEYGFKPDLTVTVDGVTKNYEFKTTTTELTSEALQLLTKVRQLQLLNNNDPELANIIKDYLDIGHKQDDKFYKIKRDVKEAIEKYGSDVTIIVIQITDELLRSLTFMDEPNHLARLFEYWKSIKKPMISRGDVFKNYETNYTFTDAEMYSDYTKISMTLHEHKDLDFENISEGYGQYAENIINTNNVFLCEQMSRYLSNVWLDSDNLVKALPGGELDTKIPINYPTARKLGVSNLMIKIPVFKGVMNTGEALNLSALCKSITAYSSTQISRGEKVPQLDITYNILSAFQVLSAEEKESIRDFNTKYSQTLNELKNINTRQIIRSRASIGMDIDVTKHDAVKIAIKQLEDNVAELKTKINEKLQRNVDRNMLDCSHKITSKGAIRVTGLNLEEIGISSSLKEREKASATNSYTKIESKTLKDNLRSLRKTIRNLDTQTKKQEELYKKEVEENQMKLDKIKEKFPDLHEKLMKNGYKAEDDIRRFVRLMPYEIQDELDVYDDLLLPVPKEIVQEGHMYANIPAVRSMEKLLSERSIKRVNQYIQSGASRYQFWQKTLMNSIVKSYGSQTSPNEFYMDKLPHADIWALFSTQPNQITTGAICLIMRVDETYNYNFKSTIKYDVIQCGNERYCITTWFRLNAEMSIHSAHTFGAWNVYQSLMDLADSSVTKNKLMNSFFYDGSRQLVLAEEWIKILYTLMESIGTPGKDKLKEKYDDFTSLDPRVVDLIENWRRYFAQSRLDFHDRFVNNSKKTFVDPGFLIPCSELGFQHLMNFSAIRPNEDGPSFEKVLASLYNKEVKFTASAEKTGFLPHSVVKGAKRFSKLNFREMIDHYNTNYWPVEEVAESVNPAYIYHATIKVSERIRDKFGAIEPNLNKPIHLLIKASSITKIETEAEFLSRTKEFRASKKRFQNDSYTQIRTMTLATAMHEVISLIKDAKRNEPRKYRFINEKEITALDVLLYMEINNIPYVSIMQGKVQSGWGKRGFFIQCIFERVVNAITDAMFIPILGETRDILHMAGTEKYKEMENQMKNNGGTSNNLGIEGDYKRFGDIHSVSARLASHRAMKDAGLVNEVIYKLLLFIEHKLTTRIVVAPKNMQWLAKESEGLQVGERLDDLVLANSKLSRTVTHQMVVDVLENSAPVKIDPSWPKHYREAISRNVCTVRNNGFGLGVFNGVGSFITANNLEAIEDFVKHLSTAINIRGLGHSDDTTFFTNLPIFDVEFITNQNKVEMALFWKKMHEMFSYFPHEGGNLVRISADKKTFNFLKSIKVENDVIERTYETKNWPTDYLSWFTIVSVFTISRQFGHGASYHKYRFSIASIIGAKADKERIVEPLPRTICSYLVDAVFQSEVNQKKAVLASLVPAITHGVNSETLTDAMNLSNFVIQWSWGRENFNVINYNKHPNLGGAVGCLPGFMLIQQLQGDAVRLYSKMVEERSIQLFDDDKPKLYITEAILTAGQKVFKEFTSDVIPEIYFAERDVGDVTQNITYTPRLVIKQKMKVQNFETEYARNKHAIAKLCREFDLVAPLDPEEQVRFLANTLKPAILAGYTSYPLSLLMYLDKLSTGMEVIKHSSSMSTAGRLGFQKRKLPNPFIPSIQEMYNLPEVMTVEEIESTILNWSINTDFLVANNINTQRAVWGIHDHIYEDHYNQMLNLKFHNENGPIYKENMKMQLQPNSFADTKFPVKPITQIVSASEINDIRNFNYWKLNIQVEDAINEETSNKLMGRIIEITKRAHTYAINHLEMVNIGAANWLDLGLSDEPKTWYSELYRASLDTIPRDYYSRSDVYRFNPHLIAVEKFEFKAREWSHKLANKGITYQQIVLRSQLLVRLIRNSSFLMFAKSISPSTHLETYIKYGMPAHRLNCNVTLEPYIGQSKAVVKTMISARDLMTLINVGGKEIKVGMRVEQTSLSGNMRPLDWNSILSSLGNSRFYIELLFKIYMGIRNRQISVKGVRVNDNEYVYLEIENTYKIYISFHVKFKIWTLWTNASQSQMVECCLRFAHYFLLPKSARSEIRDILKLRQRYNLDEELEFKRSKAKVFGGRIDIRPPEGEARLILPIFDLGDNYVLQDFDKSVEIGRDTGGGMFYGTREVFIESKSNLNQPALIGGIPVQISQLFGRNRISDPGLIHNIYKEEQTQTAVDMQPSLLRAFRGGFVSSQVKSQFCLISLLLNVNMVGEIDYWDKFRYLSQQFNSRMNYKLISDGLVNIVAVGHFKNIPMRDSKKNLGSVMVPRNYSRMRNSRANLSFENLQALVNVSGRNSNIQRRMDEERITMEDFNRVMYISKCILDNRYFIEENFGMTVFMGDFALMDINILGPRFFIDKVMEREDNAAEDEDLFDQE